MWTEAAAGVAGAAGFLSWAVRGRSSQVFGRSVWRLPQTGRRIALTFDDGPSESTPDVLDLLARHDAKATFFACGQNAERLPETVRAVSAAGHEIGNHTWSHPRLDFHSKAGMRDEIGRTQRVIQEITGKAPRLFRAPYGVRWFGLGAVQEEFGLLGAMWTAIGLDWKLSGAGVAERLLANTTEGAILCLHDGRVLKEKPDIRATLEALRILLPVLQERNFAIESLSAMLER